MPTLSDQNIPSQRDYPDRASPETEPGLAKRAARSTREAIRKNPKANRAYRATVGAVGSATTAIGVVLMPLPGPGALVTLGGLAILATEFETARKVKDAGVKGAKKVAAKAKERRERKQST